MLKKLTAAATLSFGLVAAAVAPAMACFPADAGGGDCVRTVFIICSYNQDGTGGYYVAKVIKYVNPNC